mmetsp:Transcript_104439/g.294082  ORF Transcript_104439/g.294082 Transcript_104439/m.294082 type:complete len:116 (-) Transcript_104439:458-805(-)
MPRVRTARCVSREKLEANQVKAHLPHHLEQSRFERSWRLLWQERVGNMTLPWHCHFWSQLQLVALRSSRLYFTGFCYAALLSLRFRNNYMQPLATARSYWGKSIECFNARNTQLL